MGCNCGSGGGVSTLSTANKAWLVYGTDGKIVLGSYRTEIEAAQAASRTPGATYRQEP
jgi:hypothetical protein